jgi:hypothetical protein
LLGLNEILADVDDEDWTVTLTLLQPRPDAQIVIFVLPALNPVIVIWLPDIEAVAIEGFVLLEIFKAALTEAEIVELWPEVIVTLVWLSGRFPELV